MHFDVQITPQFDLCYALADLVSPAPHFAGWRKVRAADDWMAEARALGWGFWLALPDLIEDGPPVGSTGEFLARLTALPSEEVARHLHRSLFHADQPGQEPSAEKAEWLAFIGLEDAARERDWDWCLRAANSFDRALAILELFRCAFDPVWDALQPQLLASARSTRDLALTIDFPKMVARLGLAIKVNERQRVIQALRGGYKLALSRIETVLLTPSPFNSRLLWNAAETPSSANLFLPYFLPHVSLPFGMQRTIGGSGAADPWLMCRAIGDPSRSAILRLLANRPRSASELMRSLHLSKATISEHIFMLRQASLLTERRVGRSVELSVNITAIASLGAALQAALASSSQGGTSCR